MIVALATLLFVQQDTGEQYYKFKAGCAWTYKLLERGTEKKLVMSVTKVDGDKVWVDSKEYVDDREDKVEKFTWSVDKQIVQWSKEVEDGKYEPMFHIYKAGTKKGDTWPGAPEGSSPFKLTATHSGTEEVKVLAGTYKDVVVVKLGAEAGMDEVPKISITFYLAPKVGVIKLVVDMGDDKNSLELQEFKEGK